MIKNSLYRYGDENGRVPAHLHIGKEMYNSMVKNKDVIALVNAETDERMTYGEFAQMTADIALSLTRLGVEKGDVVCICSEKRFEFLPTVLGIVCAGAVFTPIDVAYSSTSLLHRIKISRPNVVFCSITAYKTHKTTFDEVGSVQKYILYGDEEQEGALLFKNFLTETVKLEDFEPVPVNGWEDKVFILYSSGTTGLPKGVPVTHLGFSLNSQSVLRDYFNDAATCLFNTRDWCYSYGLWYTMSSLRFLMTTVFHPNSRSGVQEMLEAIQKYKVNVILLVPSIITELINSHVLDEYDIKSVKYMVSSSTYVREEVVAAIKKRLPNLVSILQMYGLTEAGAVCNELGAHQGFKAGSSGTPGLGFIMKVVDLSSRKPLGANQSGEICIKGPSVMKGYLNNVIPDCFDGEGFLKTGDVGYYDEDGYFFIVNRIKELIKFNDVSITPAEFEALLLQHPSVREAGVVGKPHPKHGEAPVAFVVLQPGCTATEEELVHHVDSRLIYKMRLAGGVRFVNSLPRTAGDKLDRQELKRRLEEEDANRQQCKETKSRSHQVARVPIVGN